ncbi:MAG: hypothetical protein WCI72_00380 [archaeon]
MSIKRGSGFVFVALALFVFSMMFTSAVVRTINIPSSVDLTKGQCQVFNFIDSANGNTAFTMDVKTVDISWASNGSMVRSGFVSSACYQGTGRVAIGTFIVGTTSSINNYNPSSPPQSNSYTLTNALSSGSLSVCYVSTSVSYCRNLKVISIDVTGETSYTGPTSGNTGSTCVDNGLCTAANTCSGLTCTTNCGATIYGGKYCGGGAGVGVGACVPNNACAVATCSSTTCLNTCNLPVQGTKTDGVCAGNAGVSASTTVGQCFTRCSGISVQDANFPMPRIINSPNSCPFGTRCGSLINIQNMTPNKISYDFVWEYNYADGSSNVICPCNATTKVYENIVRAPNVTGSYQLPIVANDFSNKIVSNVSLYLVAFNDTYRSTVSKVNYPVSNLVNVQVNYPCDNGCYQLGLNAPVYFSPGQTVGTTVWYKTCVKNANNICLKWSSKVKCTNGLIFNEQTKSCGVNPSLNYPNFNCNNGVCNHSGVASPYNSVLDATKSCGISDFSCFACNNGFVADSTQTKCVKANCNDNCSSTGGFCTRLESVNNGYNKVHNCVELQNMSANLTANYELANDIDCSDTINWNSGAGFKPIGNITSPFTGNFNGNSFIISNLKIDLPLSSSWVGLFGRFAGNISNVGLININISGGQLVGGLVGQSSGIISNSYTTGKVNGYVGNIGGLVGQQAGGVISNSYSLAEVISANYGCGGLVGNLNSGTISNSYSAGSVSCSSSIGGFIGIKDGGEVYKSFYNNETSGLNDNDGRGIPKTTVQMKDLSIFSTNGWDFANIWGISSSINDGYLYLKKSFGGMNINSQLECCTGEVCVQCSEGSHFYNGTCVSDDCTNLTGFAPQGFNFTAGVNKTNSSSVIMEWNYVSGVAGACQWNCSYGYTLNLSTNNTCQEIVKVNCTANVSKYICSNLSISNAFNNSQLGFCEDSSKSCFACNTNATLRDGVCVAKTCADDGLIDNGIECVANISCPSNKCTVKRNGVEKCVPDGLKMKVNNTEMYCDAVIDHKLKPLLANSAVCSFSSQCKSNLCAVNATGTMVCLDVRSQVNFITNALISINCFLTNGFSWSSTAYLTCVDNKQQQAGLGA